MAKTGQSRPRLSHSGGPASATRNNFRKQIVKLFFVNAQYAVLFFYIRPFIEQFVKSLPQILLFLTLCNPI